MSASFVRLLACRHPVSRLRPHGGPVQRAAQHCSVAGQPYLGQHLDAVNCVPSLLMPQRLHAWPMGGHSLGAAHAANQLTGTTAGGVLPFLLLQATLLGPSLACLASPASSTTHTARPCCRAWPNSAGLHHRVCPRQPQRHCVRHVLPILRRSDLCCGWVAWPPARHSAQPAWA